MLVHDMADTLVPWLPWAVGFSRFGSLRHVQLMHGSTYEHHCSDGCGTDEHVETHVHMAPCFPIEGEIVAHVVQVGFGLLNGTHGDDASNYNRCDLDRLN